MRHFAESKQRSLTTHPGQSCKASIIINEPFVFIHRGITKGVGDEDYCRSIRTK